MNCVALTSDLVFRSKIVEAATSAGVSMTFVRDEAKLREALTPTKEIELLIIELNTKAFDFFVPLESLLKSAKVARVIAYCAHVDTELMGRANEIGIAEVMPRSRFVKILPELFTEQNSEHEDE